MIKVAKKKLNFGGGQIEVLYEINLILSDFKTINDITIDKHPSKN